nr:PREDICTED: uncharacterized protein LOC105669265 [Linepithema humile]XP_012217560.1 PREDICTED: uncharacterized protein LOC105669265 [Linepithema humile]
MESPKEDWKKCKIKKIVGQAGSYEQAVDKVAMALEFSDIESITPEEYKKSRRIRVKIQHSDDAYGSDGDSSDALPVKRRNTSKVLPSFSIAPNEENMPKSKNPKGSSIMRKSRKSDVVVNNMSQQDFQFIDSPTQKCDDENDINEIEKDDGAFAKNGNSEPNIALESVVLKTSSMQKLDPLKKMFKKIEEQQDKPVEIAYMQEILFLQHKILVQLEELKKKQTNREYKTRITRIIDRYNSRHLQICRKPTVKK